MTTTSTNADDYLQRGRNPGKRPRNSSPFKPKEFESQYNNFIYKYTREYIHKVTKVTQIISSKVQPESQNPKCGRIRKIFNFSRINLPHRLSGRLSVWKWALRINSIINLSVLPRDYEITKHTRRGRCLNCLQLLRNQKIPNDRTGKILFGDKTKR